MDEIINYVMDTPGNTNPNVLKGMLDQLDNGGSSSLYTFKNDNRNLELEIIIKSINEDESQVIQLSPNQSEEIEIPVWANKFIINMYTQS